MKKPKQKPDMEHYARLDAQLRHEAAAPAFQKVIAYNRRWLDARGLLRRPWFILGSAPEPTIPAQLPPDTAMIYVKYAGNSARKLGLPDADMTFLLGKTEPAQISGLKVGHILNLDNELSWKTRLARIGGFTRIAQGEMSHRERDLFVVHCVGSLFPETRDKRPSNGLALICYALAVGVPQIIIAGVSLDRDGYEYNDDPMPRRHRNQDRKALTLIAERDPHVVTSEAGLRKHTGLTLFV